MVQIKVCLLFLKSWLTSISNSAPLSPRVRVTSPLDWLGTVLVLAGCVTSEVSFCLSHFLSLSVTALIATRKYLGDNLRMEGLLWLMVSEGSTIIMDKAWWSSEWRRLLTSQWAVKQRVGTKEPGISPKPCP